MAGSITWQRGDVIIDGVRLPTSPRVSETDDTYRTRVEAQNGTHIAGGTLHVKVVARDDIRVCIQHGGIDTLARDWWMTDAEREADDRERDPEPTEGTPR